MINDTYGLPPAPPKPAAIGVKNGGKTPIGAIGVKKSGPREVDTYNLPSGAVRLSNVKPETVAWLWPGRLPLGKLVVIDGDPSVGKSTLAVDLAAHVSTGTPWPDRQPCPKGAVIILTAEDGLADTVAPRLLAAGGDPAQVVALDQVEVLDPDNNATLTPPVLPRDTGYLARLVQTTGARLVIVDVLMAYLDGRKDAHHDQDVRGALAPLAHMADAAGCCVVMLRHMTKDTNRDAIYRGGGSIGIVGAARAGYVVARDPDNPETVVMACTKSNLAKMPPALMFQLVGHDLYQCARVQWLGESTLTANELVNHPETDDERQQRNDTQQWLLDHLATNGGEDTAADVLKIGMAAGFTKDDIKNARARCRNPRIISSRQGFGKGSVVMWKISIDVNNPKPPIYDTYGTYGSEVTPMEDPTQPTNPEGKPA